MKANELRRAFTQFFVERGHTDVPSASLIPHDSSLLFVPAGMVPFKSYFVGEQKPPYSRAVSVQKCVRAGGKHNDLDEVGRTARHLTFFEMLGNFSFGDYFKEQAIVMAWEFVTEVLQLDTERLWITVHETDDEAARIWEEKIGVPAERIQRLDEDNWWRMADTGPNGPCSEIFWDKGPAYGADGGPAHGDEDRFIEFWNLVFMQFETDEAGVTVDLPKPSIDTGAGLERILSILQQKDSVFEIDEMARLIEAAEAVTGYKLGQNDNSDLALRVLAEHARTMTFLIADDVVPSNEDRGFVLRRIMRRAIRFAYLLGVDELVTPKLVDAVVEIMADDYPKLAETHESVRLVVSREETQFRKTLAAGSSILANHLDSAESGKPLDGEVAFLLHDTYGFPFEVTSEVAAERGFDVDRAGFDRAMEKQRAMSKDARKIERHADDSSAVAELAERHGETVFVGRDELVDVPAKVLLVTAEGDTASIFVDRSPFYAESGGQIGDTGSITTATGRAEILDTNYAAPGIHRHIARIVDGEINTGDDATLTVDTGRRDNIRRHHTATHLLHWALRNVVGDHVKQQGSLVAPDRLRFDFSHFEPLTPEQINAIEDQVNIEVLSNPATEHPEVAKTEAEEMGAIAFFGDKYGDLVRVLRAGPTLEFCGGTHVSALGDIGLIKIVSEGSVGSNLRRIEAVCGTGAIDLLRQEQRTVETIAESLQVPKGDAADGVRRKIEEVAGLHAEVQQLQGQVAASKAVGLAASAVDGVVIARVDGIARDQLKELTLAIRDHDGVDVVVLGGAPAQGGAALAAATTKESTITAGELIADGAKVIKGGGGKGDHFAMAGGKDPEGLDEALKLATAAAGL